MVFGASLSPWRSIVLEEKRRVLEISNLALFNIQLEKVVFLDII